MLENIKQNNCFLISGVIFCMSATVDPELLELVQGHVNQLSTDLDKMKFENQEEMNNLWLMLKSIQEKLQVEHEKRFEKLERAQDVLQTNQNDLYHEIDAVHQEQSSAAVKVDNLVITQDDLHHEIDALHKEQSSTAVKMDNLVANQDVVHHKMGALHQKQRSTAVRLDNVVTNQGILHREIEALSQEQSSTTVKVDRLHISQEAFQQRVMELESHSNCGISYGKYTLDNILPSQYYFLSQFV